MGLFYLAHHTESTRTSLNLLYPFFSCRVLTDMNKPKEHAMFSIMNMYFCTLHAKYCLIPIRLGRAPYIMKSD